MVDILALPMQYKGYTTIVIITVALAITAGVYSTGHDGLATLSYFIGWLYFFAWSASFYFQPILNYKRKSTVGLSYNFLWLNVAGFLCLSIYTCAFYFSEQVQRDYFVMTNGSVNTVMPNDVVFALHALLLCALTLLQVYCVGYEQSPGRQTWIPVRIVVVGIALFIVVWVSVIFSRGNPDWIPGQSNVFTTVEFVYILSYFKIAISFVKYLPQLWMNFRLKSTTGWSIHNILLDFTGGVLSLAQLVLDAGRQDDYGAITENPVKLGLSIISIVFDLCFLCQHYVLYPQKPETLPTKESLESDVKQDGSDGSPAEHHNSSRHIAVV